MLATISCTILAGLAFIFFVYVNAKIQEDTDRSIEHVKDHQQWQDSERERLMHRCADIERKQEEMMKWLEDLKMLYEEHRNEVSKVLIQNGENRKAISRLSHALEIVIAKVEELKQQ